MNRNQVTVRYAKALIEAASELNIVDEIEGDLRILAEVFDNFKGFTNFFVSDVVKASAKSNAVHSMFRDKFQPLTLKFLELIIHSRREEYIKDIVRNSIDLIRSKKGIITAYLTTAYEMSNEYKKQIINKFEKSYNSTIELNTNIDPKLLGGFIFTIDNNCYDASLSSQIKAIKKEFQIK